jgi:potassium-dependent mechanosensitive channel
LITTIAPFKSRRGIALAFLPLEGLNQWQALMERSLSAVGDQALRQSLRVADTRLTVAERDSAKQIHAALQERASVDLRAIGALSLVQDLTARLDAELSAQIARTSTAVKIRSLLDDASAGCRRIWNTELYIAEDSVIANGQKVSMPRSITLGKVLIALAIFLFGLLAARAASLFAKKSRWFAGEQKAAGVPAKIVGAAVALVALLVAMASVRIPWTVFAFMGGALAIGVGFGAKTLINNFISGIILLCESSIRVGDIVEVDDQRGKVVRVGFRNSLIARGDGVEVLVPNSQFLEQKVVNWTLTSDLVRSALTVRVAYGASPAQVAPLIAQAAAQHPHVMKDPAPDVLFEDFGETALLFTLKFWMHLAPTVDGGTVRSELRHSINTLFEQARIVVVSPRHDVRLEQPLQVQVVNSQIPASIRQSNPMLVTTG